MILWLICPAFILFYFLGTEKNFIQAKLRTTAQGTQIQEALELYSSGLKYGNGLYIGKIH